MTESNERGNSEPPRMLDLLNGFVVELRNAGLPVSLTENLDAMEAVQHIPITTASRSSTPSGRR